MKSHRFDAISFISGLVAALVGLVFLVPQTPVDLIDAVTSLGAWFWPVLLLVIGLAVLIPVFATKSAEEEEATPVPVSGPGDELG
jgi:formate-dependent nitrite reductase membrane component NrfD